MMRLLSSKLLFVAILIIVTASSFIFLTHDSHVDFTTQVKPIINRSCITCHGGVRQKGGFSLLFRDEALAKTESGKRGIVPGDPNNSEMIRRINLKNPEERMPYKHDPLSKDEIDILTKWVKEGAPWGEHWAYVPVKEIAVPQPTSFLGLIHSKSDWAKNAIDNFIEQKLNEQELKPSSKADKNTLLRRVSLDVIGMPAPKPIAEKYLSDSSDKAYPELVDSLLALPNYGEKWASMWLDIARYADSKGYERDDSRNIWKYRDWLIASFNNDKPYNQFLTEQIAGDLLPAATDDDYIATAFHRNTMTNDEGGTDNEEFRTSAVLDRVNTTWQGIMGTTFACVQCHSHPYDPFKHEDYYKFMAFFNDTRDEDTQADYPLLRDYNDTLQQEVSNVVKWVKTNVSLQKAKEVNTFLKTWQPSYNSLTCDSFSNSELNDTKWLAFRNKAVCRLKKVDLQDKTELIFRYQAYTKGGVWQIHIDEPAGEVIATIPLPLTKNGWTITKTNLSAANGTHDLFFTYINNNLKKPTDNGALFDWFYFTEEFPGQDKQGYAEVKNEFWKLLTANVSATPVMMDNPTDMHRASFVFERGNWLTKGKMVQPDVPKSLNPFPAKAPRNRLGLAMWLTSTENPLTARTMVNRVWEQIFGTGIAETLEDLGSQGIAPSHVELLDWLSYQFMHDDKWRLKKLLRKILLSATYQQDSKVSQELLQKDPYNKYYARGPRIRLSAEQVRDQALCISGLISSKMYGPSVYPFQPKGIWLSPWNGAEWTQSKGEDQYRRAVYTYWKRSAAYPSMLTFDGVSREVCTARRIRTNTPLQALATLNDSAYIDIARHFALRMQSGAAQDVTKQISTGYTLATNHAIDDKRIKALKNLYYVAYNKFKNAPDKTCEMIGEMGDNTNAETAALTVVANAILNLDEVVTKN
ncbi:DUF1553 domain-containing protein [Segetibacter koreensis]|uniref:DUF1553 domain-containing protein n=1 Tax=Segetibacter koreensis TaxID=398037 RepID=UPI00035EF680|nr:DUF1553 domain-containing protein [Segetibacter koreensis]